MRSVWGLAPDTEQAKNTTGFPSPRFLCAIFTTTLQMADQPGAQSNPGESEGVPGIPV